MTAQAVGQQISLSFGPFSLNLTVIGVAALAWALGTLNVFSPSGVGTRELVLIYGLQGFVGPAELLALSAMVRLAAVAGELLLFSALAWWSANRPAGVSGGGGVA